MTTSPETSRPISEHISREEPPLYVEELAGEGDYWLSITDAARVCRVQDVSIRRAISRRVLPVRRQRAGQNKRTRFVRASDLPKAGFPIIDESAAITTEIGKVDILSIPRQQQRILQDHQQLMGRLEAMQETLIGQQTQVLAKLEQQKEQFQIKLRNLQEKQEEQIILLTQQFAQAQEVLQHTIGEIEQDQTRKHLALRRDLTEVQNELHQHKESVQDRVLALKTAFELYQQEMQRSLTKLTASQQQAFQAYLQTVREMFQQAEQETRKQLAAFEQRIMQIAGDLERSMQLTRQQVDSLTEKLSLSQQFAEDLSQSIIARDRELDRLLQQQQTQLSHLTRLLPLLPYAGQRLVTGEDASEWKQALIDLETRLLREQRQELARYQPLLSLLSPAHWDALMRLIQEKQEKLTD
jgi:chromosome segregation ATPase